MNVDSINRQKAQQYKYTRVIFQMVVIYFLCWYPSMLISYLIPFDAYDYSFGGISQLLIVINALLDPLVYLWTIKDLRTRLHKVLCFWNCKAANLVNPSIAQQTIHSPTANSHLELTNTTKNE